MTTYFVSSAGSNTAPYDTWAKAATSLQTALTAASTSGDRVIVQYNAVPAGDKELTADKTYTFAANISLIAASADDAGTAFTPTPMGSAGDYIGNSATAWTITLTGGFVVYQYGITYRNAGTANKHMMLTGSDNSVYVFDNCYLWHGNTNATVMAFGANSSVANSKTVLRNTTLRFGAASQGVFAYSGALEFEGVTLSADGAIPTTLFQDAGGSTMGPVTCVGCDFSALGGSSNLVGAQTIGYRRFVFTQCKLSATAGILATQTVTNASSMEVELVDCASGDQHYHYGYYNALGTLTVVTDKYVTADGATYDGVNKCTWRVASSANATYENPFRTPWFGRYNGTVGTAITPYLEVMRAEASAPTGGIGVNDDEVWVEVVSKATSGSTRGTIYSDRRAIGATAAAQTASALTAADWTGEDANNWFGKLDVGSITPQEIGDIAVRVCVARDISNSSGVTLYVDPKVRGL